MFEAFSKVVVTMLIIFLGVAFGIYVAWQWLHWFLVPLHLVPDVIADLDLKYFYVAMSTLRMIVGTNSNPLSTFQKKVFTKLGEQFGLKEQPYFEFGGAVLGHVFLLCLGWVFHWLWF